MELSLTWPSGLDIPALTAAVYRPRRPRLDEARALLAGITRPREALELAAARGLIPMDWLTSSERAFGGENHSPRLIPHDVSTVVELVSDAPNILAAEELARVFVQRASLWCDLPVSFARVHWKPNRKALRRASLLSRQVPRIPPLLNQLVGGFFYPAELAMIRDELADAGTLRRAPVVPRKGLRGLLDVARNVFASQVTTDPFAEWQVALTKMYQSPEPAIAQALTDHRTAWLFSVLCEVSGPVRESFLQRSAPAFSYRIRGVRFVPANNPFEPLAALWWTGYGLHFVGAKRIELFLPPVEEG
ncbi:MAG: hypothetical protein Q8Q09_18360 [Deltaproteobacteria bacterium]|nr:hypothetical protein [Deltaproteobacteria bacterium]